MNILFICTHNRCRSILAEAVTNHFGEGLVTAASAGSEPAGEIHPGTLDCLSRHAVPAENLYSKSWDAMPAFEPDFIITVCNSAARETCPVWFGRSLQAHWDIADPSRLEDDGARQAAFDATFALFRQRVLALVELLQTDPDRTRIVQALEAFEKTPHFTGGANGPV